MDTALAALAYLGATWLLAGIVLGLLGGFGFIRRVELSDGHAPKPWVYWVTLIVLYPVILLRAAIRAMWETTIGGAR